MGNCFDPVLNQVLTRGMVLTDQWSLVVFDPGDGSVVASAPEGDGRRVVDIKWLCSPEGEGRVVGKNGSVRRKESDVGRCANNGSATKVLPAPRLTGP